MKTFGKCMHKNNIYFKFLMKICFCLFVFCYNLEKPYGLFAEPENTKTQDWHLEAPHNLI